MLLSAILLFAASPAFTETELESIVVSPDTTTRFGNLTVRDHNAFADDLHGMRVPVSLGPLPEQVAVNALHELQDGIIWFSLDSSADLNGLVVAPADVVAWDGGAYSLVFQASAAGVPAAANVDAVTMIDGELALSFDVALDLPGGPFFDNDLAIWDGTTFWLAFGGIGSGVPVAADLDAAHRLDNGHFLLSFDTGGSVAGIVFADEDILEHDPGAATWELIYDGSAAHPSWGPADLDALSVGERREILEIPTLSTPALLLLILILALAGAGVVRRRRVVSIR